MKKEASVMESFFDEVAYCTPAALLKKITPSHTFPCKYCEFFQKNSFKEHV